MVAIIEKLASVKRILIVGHNKDIICRNVDGCSCSIGDRVKITSIC